jgi:hypothetical protein
MADVEVTFGAQIEELISSVNEIKSQLGTLGEHTKAIGEGMKASFEGFMETVKEFIGVGGLTEIIHQVMELGTQTLNMSRLLGVSTETVGGLKVAAESAGTSLDAMALVGERLMVNIERSTRDGLNPAAQALHNLGLTANDFKGLNFQDSLALIADKAGQFDNSTGAVTRSLTLLIGRNQALIPLLLQGGDAYRRSVEEGSKVAGMSEEQAEALHHAEAEWVKLKNTLVALAGGELSKDLQGTFKEINDLIHGQGEFLASVSENWQRLKDMLSNTGAALNASATNTMTATKGIQFLTQNMVALNSGPMIEAAKQIAGLSTEVANMGESVKQHLAEIDFNAKDHLGAFIKQIEDTVRQIQSATARQDALYKQDVEKFSLSRTQMLQKQIESGDRMVAAVTYEYDQILARDDLSATQRAEIQAKITAAQDEWATKRIEITTSELTAVRDAFLSVGNQILSAWNSNLKGLLDGTMTWAEAFKNTWKSLMIAVIEYIEKIIVEMMALFAASLITGIPIGEMGVTGVTGAIAKVFKLQEGTMYVPETTLALVHKGEMVIPAGMADAIRAGGGPSTNNNLTLNMNVSTPDTSTMALWLRGPGGQLIARTVAQMWSQNPGMRPAYG